MFDNVEILVDLESGAISVVMVTADGGTVEIERVLPDEEFAPRE